MVVGTRIAASLILLSLVTVAPAGSAQEGGLTWWMSDYTGGNGEGSFLSLEPASGNANTATCTGCAGAGDFTITSAEREPAADGYLALGDAGSAVVFVKSWNNAPAPDTRVRVTVLADDEPVATGSATNDVLLGAIVRFDVPLAYTGGDLPAGTLLSWTVAIDDANTGSYNPAAYPRGDDTNHWGFTLPLAPVVGEADAPALVNGTVENSTVAHAFENATSDTYVLEWNATATNVTISLRASVQNGTANVTVRDGANATVYEATLDGNTSVPAGNATGNATAPAVTGAPGVWTVTVTYDRFVGSLDLSLAETVAVPETNSTSEPTLGANVGEESPGPALPLLALGLLAAVGAVRRRK